MPCRPHINLAGVPQHIVQRGINREPCFCAEEDYHFYLHWLEKSATDWHCHIHAYALMSNHVHLLLTPKQSAPAWASDITLASVGGPIERWMKRSLKQ